MKLPARVLAPIAVALLCTVALLAVLWWQLRQSTGLLFQAARQGDTTASGELIPTSFNDPSSTDVAVTALRRGDIASLRGDWQEALVQYQRAVDQDGGVPALRKLAQAQLQIRDNDGIGATIEEMERLGASADDVALLRSIVQLRRGELLEAQATLDAASDSPQQHYGRALLAVVQGNHDFAQTELQLVSAGWEPVLRSHAKTLQGAYTEYVLFPESPQTHLITLLSRALAQVQQCELALPLLVQVTTQTDDYRDAWIVQGYCELTTGRLQPSILSLERAYNLDPEKPETQYFLGRAHLEMQSPANALTFFEYALANGFEPQAEVRHYIAETALQLQNIPLAFQHYTFLVEAENAELSAYAGYVETALMAGQNADAYTKARLAAEKFPRDALAFVLLGKAAAATDHEDEARNALEAALDLDPTRSDARELLDTL